MSIAFYMDHNVPLDITVELRLRHVDVLTAYEDQQHKTADPLLLDRAYELERVLFTRDKDFLIEANRRLQIGQPFYGVVYAHQMRVSIGQCIHDLELIAKISKPSDWYNTVEFLPL